MKRSSHNDFSYAYRLAIHEVADLLKNGYRKILDVHLSRSWLCTVRNRDNNRILTIIVSSAGYCIKEKGRIIKKVKTE